MPTDHRTALAKIKRFDQLIAYLRDEMGWPIARNSFEDVDDLFYDFTADELGIDPKTAAKIESIKRLRPLSPKQPWGIFFIKFEPKKLPVVALRRILSQVALKKRASANSAERAAWAADDLLFVSNYGGVGDERRITFAHFSKSQDGHDLPTLKVLGWDNLDTALHLDAVAKELTQHLAWPDDETDVEAWRKRWGAAFTLRNREVVTTSHDLSIRLAELAQAIRDRIRTALSIETESGPLTKLMKAFQEALVHDLDADGFADMYAQTIAYGLLLARIADPEKKTVDDFAAHMRTNPFLRELMETFLKVGGRRGKAGGPGIDFDELGVSEVIELLDDANMEAVVGDFGDKNPQEDPVIHFYEDFLAAYDKKQKVSRGVFYTPQPVVSYIVRSVHQLLQTEFGLADGLADTETWGEMVRKNPGLKIPNGLKSNDPFVQILDPATGTATFLVEAIDVIYRTLASKWGEQHLTDAQQRAAWNDYVPKYLLPRLHGYELMMAPYAIAHMKVGLKLFETGYRFDSNERARIYLTNALEPPHDFSDRLSFDVPALAHEAHAVNVIKRNQCFTVVLGNPPYSGVSSNRNDWIEGLLKGDVSTGRATANYYEVDGESLAEKKIWLKDDYVKFMRLSHFLLERSGAGIHGMITNHSYVDSPTCRGMRFQMQQFYSLLSVIDLHGSTKKGEEPPDGLSDENVFDILPGVAISVCVKNARRGGAPVQSHDLWGTRAFKSDWLLQHRFNDVEWNPVLPTSPYYLFVKRRLDFEGEYRTFWSLKEIFPFYGTGIQTSRDDFATDWDRAALKNRLRTFFDLKQSDRQVAETFGLSDTRGWKIKEIRRVSDFDKIKKTIIPYLFRIFDKRWIALTKDVVDWPRLDVMSSVGRDRLGLLCSRQQSTPGFRHALVVDVPTDMFCISNKSREGQTLFPLFVLENGGLFQSSRKPTWQPNLGVKFARDFCKLLSMEGQKLGEDTITDDDAKRALGYIYALLYSADYRDRYSDLLKMDYPRLPLTEAPKLFRALAKLGGELIALHLLATPKLDKPHTQFIGDWNPEVEKISWSNQTVWIDKEKTTGFKGVPEAVWNFRVGGYQVCEKWLKDRKGRTLSKNDIAHYQRIIVALAETIRLMKEIDEVIDKHGGWPGAFQSARSTDAAGARATDGASQVSG